ncbi:MAG: glycosyltransferase [Lachnospiraceae bacterium]|nr:glycosyltransferase [Lachnospiraceae bacterium]
MKIFFIFDSTYPFYTGGIETWIYNVCERLIEKHEITIFTVKNFRNNNSMGQFENINPKIQIIPVKNLNHVPGIRHLVHKHIALFNSNITAYSMYREIKKHIDSEETYFLIGLGTVFAAKTVRMIKKEYTNVKAIASSRGLHPEAIAEEYPGSGPIVKNMEKKNLGKMDTVWSNGQDTQQALRNKGFESIVIKNGVDFDILDREEAFNYKSMGLENEFIIVTIGTVAKWKGYFEIIKAVKILKERYNLIVHFVGIGKVNDRNRNKYESFANNAGVAEQVHLIGEHRNVVSYAKGADIVVCASGGGGYGMAALESMVSRTPIVAWNSPVYQQMLVDGESAKLVKPWDEKALADGIYYMYRHKKEAKEWGENAHRKAKEFDWSIVIEEIEESLKSL